MAPASTSRPVRVGDVLAAAVPGLGDRMLEERIRSGWADVVGAEFARRSRPGELRAGVLTVIVDNSPWLHEMTLRSRELLAALDARHGSMVTSLRFSLGEVRRPRPSAPRRRADAPARLSGEEERALETAAAAIGDPALAASVRRLMTKDLIARRQRGAPSPARRED